MRAEWRPREPERGGPRRGVSSWGQVEKKREEPTLSVLLLCARPRAGPQVPCAILRPCRASVGLGISVEGPVGGVGGVGVLAWRCLSPRAQVYATSLEWGQVCTERPAGWIGGPNRPPPSRARGAPVRPSELPDPGPVPSHPAASRWAKASRGRPGPEAGWWVRWEDGVPAPGQATGPGTRGSGRVWHFLLPKICVWW